MTTALRRARHAGAALALLVLAACAGVPTAPTAPAPPARPAPSPAARPASPPASQPVPPAASAPAPRATSAPSQASAPASPSSSAAANPPITAAPAAPAAPGGRAGAFYLDDGPGDRPVDLDSIREPEPRVEPLHRFANNPYNVFGQAYVPEQRLRAGVSRGVASWYGRRFHGKPTANGETYDMYQISAAHPTLPIPSYARVTNVANGRSVVVRINDRGPFLHGRVMDLSFAAAAKLGYVEQGSALVEIESLDPSDSFASRPPVVAASRPAPPPVAPPPVATAPPARGAPIQSSAASGLGFPMLEDRAGIFLQVGAFQSPDNAESMLVRLLFQLDDFAGRLRVVMRDGLHRIVAGPFRDRGEANVAATRLAAIR